MTVPALDRRTLIAGLAALTAVAPSLAASPAPLRKSPRLRVGDTIGLIEPASASDEPFQLQLVEETIAAMGLKSKRAPNLLQRDGYLAGTDRARADGINRLFADTEVRAIFAVRGGWGSARTLPLLDWKMIRANPKLVLGFSDITALHMAIAAQGGFVTLHGPNAGSSWGKASFEQFKAIAFDGATPTYVNPVAAEDRLVQRRWRTRTIWGGKAQGRLLGGNLTVLTSLVGTPYLPDFTGAILFLEDVDEAEYRIDRMLTQLGLAGILSKVAGVVFGQCTDCVAKNTERGYGGFTLSALLDQHFGRLGVPVYQGAFFGHIPDQFTLPVGGLAEIDADAGTIRLLEAAVS